MIKKSLIAITVVALLAVSAQAFEGKIHWQYEMIPVAWEPTGDPIPVQVGEYDVTFHIPYYAIVDPQEGEIELTQVEGGGLNFCGSIDIEASANFDASLTCELVPNAAGLLIQDDVDLWTCQVDDGVIDANADTEEMTITVCVEAADLLVGLQASTTISVAVCNLFIAPL